METKSKGCQLQAKSCKNIWNLDHDNFHAFVCCWASPPDILAIYFRIWW